MILDCKQLSKEYLSGTQPLTVLSNLDLKVSAGAFIAITGESGSGKSTLLHLLGALDTPSAGEIYFQEENLATLREKQRNRIRSQNFGFVFQFHYLLAEFSASENVALAGMISREGNSNLWERANELLSDLKLAERLDHRPMQLSGWEQQRVAVARALVNEPDILFMDEPTGNLDPASSDELIELIQQQQQKRNLTIVMVTHNPEIAAKADQHWTLDGGSLQLNESTAGQYHR